MLNVAHQTVGLGQENTYVVYNDEKNALIFDPGAQAEDLIRWIDENQWKPQAILITHTHYDHIGAVDALREHYDVEVHVSDIEKDHLSDPELNLSARHPQPVSARPAEHTWTQPGKYTVGDFTFRIEFIPGHSSGHVVYFFDKEGFAINGDVVFNGSIGRTDLGGGGYVPLIKGIAEHIVSLPGDYILYPGHGPQTTVANEVKTNPFFEMFRRNEMHEVNPENKES